MLSLNIKPVNADVVSRALQYIPNGLESVVRKAIRKSLQAGKREAKSRATRRYTLPAGIVSRSLAVRTHTFSGEMTSKGKRNPIDLAKVKPNRRITARGVYPHAEVVRGQGGYLKNAFRGYGTPLMKRLTASRYPIAKVKTISAPGMVIHPAVSEPTFNKISQVFETEFLNIAGAML